MKDRHTDQQDGAPISDDRSRRQLGMVLRDSEARDNMTFELAVSESGAEVFRRDLYVGIRDTGQDIEFLGRVVAGPFYPESEGKAIEGTVEVMGQIESHGRIRPTPTRPRPGSDVYTFAADRLQELLSLQGNFYIGRLSGASGVHVRARSDDKGFLPRNLGIFGTVGSGKSNTAQVMMEEAIDAGWAVVVVDVEGEYVRMDDSTDEPVLIDLLETQHGITPSGLPDFHVYEPASGRSEARAADRFKVPISEMPTNVVSDILEFTDPQARMFEAITRSATGRNEYLDLQKRRQPDRFQRPNPRSIPQPVPAGRGGEATKATQANGLTVDSPDVEEEADTTGEETVRPYDLQDLIDGLQESNQAVGLLPRIRSEDLPTAATLRTKLVHLAKSGVLDSKEAEHVPDLPVEDLMVSGKLSVLDVSETEDQSRNITIAYVLQALFERVVATPVGERMPNGEIRPPLFVVIEEVHNFVSRSMAERMRSVLDSLQIISRRGRKRWMALALISQQPNHVPDELFELANTRFIHQMKAVSNLDVLKQTTGGVNEALWSAVPVLGAGRCLATGTIFGTPLIIDVRPAKSRRMFVH